ncbi:hypothetical protein MUGA111182_03555 [Mucilaginibacter galii]|uniref:Uncharacterized protein n=1 Tax=Mucilaginibacter galii TaxID=2005073 RepID=A0A917J9K2_9SPHI|nr:hypothetical protein [Mucilaginibacter galii]GGI50460.1 hypothetical protein GCM10011425_16720 [Mucilaginibacter galii]
MDHEALDIFKNLLITAVNNVAPAYLSTHYNEASDIIKNTFGSQRITLKAKVIGNSIIQTGERVFCYELYHQLRMLMDQHMAVFQNVCLQGELKKMQIIHLAERLGLRPLTAAYIPDFLLHSPSVADEHPYIIEVKTSRTLSWEEVVADISKIAEFMTRYNYQRGVFITTAIKLSYVLNTRIANNNLLRNIPNINRLANEIYILNREDEFHGTTCLPLSQILTPGFEWLE